METENKERYSQEQPIVDVRVLGRINAAQNIEFALPDLSHLADFFAEVLLTIPGVASDWVCLGAVTANKGENRPLVCDACLAKRRQAAADSLESAFSCEFAAQTGCETTAISSLKHFWGFFVIRVSDRRIFTLYQPFISNLANYVALSLENRWQRDLLQQAHDDLEHKVEERTLDLRIANQQLQDEIEIRKQTENALRESEQQISNLIENSPIAMLVSSGPEERVEWINDQFIKLFGYTIDDLPDVDHWWPLAYPDEAEREATRARWVAQVQKAIEYSSQTEPFEVTVACKDGKQRFVEVRLSAIGKKNLVTFVDLTERKQAERQIRMLNRALDEASDAIYVQNSDFHFVYANAAACRAHGYDKNDLLNLNPMDLTPDYNVERAIGLLSRMNVTDEIPRAEIRHKTRDGKIFPVEISVSVFHQDGEPYSLSIARDISERRQHELEREAVIRVSNALRKAISRAEMLTIILDQLLELFTADGAILAVVHPESHEIIIEMGRGLVGEKFMGQHIPSGSGASWRVITSKQPYMNNAADQDHEIFRPDWLEKSNCVAAVPLIAQEQVAGVLWVIRKIPFHAQNLRLFSAIGDIAANALYRVTLHEQTERHLRHLTALHEIDMAITNNFNLEKTLDYILLRVKNELVMDAASILLLEPQSQILKFAAGTGFQTRAIEKSQVKVGSGKAGQAALDFQTLISQDIGEVSTVFNRKKLLVDEGFSFHCVAPLLVKGQAKGVLEVFRRQPFDPDPDWVAFFETLATQTAIAIENTTLLENLQHSNAELTHAYDATIEGWSRAMDLRDKETEGHTLRVTEMALKLANSFALSDTEKLNLRRGALFHDMGKLAIPDVILFKPGPLDPVEWEIMRQHPTYAYEMLRSIKYLQPAIDVPYCHHENWDGSGYPRGLKGKDIPRIAQIFSIVDVFDALTVDRPYRQAWPVSQALGYIREQSGKKFDPEIVEVFLKMDWTHNK